MVTIIPAPKPLIPQSSAFIGTYHRNTLYGNAILPVVASNPFVNAGKLPWVTSENRIQTDPMGGSSKSPGAPIDIIVAPSLLQIVRGMTLSNLINEVTRAYEVEAVLSRQVHPRTVGEAIRSHLVSTTGYFLTELCNQEAFRARPVAISHLYEGSNTPFAILNGFIRSFIEKGSYQMGAEAPMEQTPMYIVAQTETPNDHLITAHLTLNAYYSGAASSAMKDNQATVKGNKLSKAPKSVPTNIYCEALFDFLLALQDVQKISAAVDACSAAVPTDNLKYLMDNQVQYYKDSVGASQVLAYFIVAPMIKRLAYLLDVLKMPVMSERLNDIPTRILEHEKVKEFISKVENFRYPFLQAEEMAQTRGISLNAADKVEPCFMVEKTIFDACCKSDEDYLSFFVNGTFFSDIIALNRLMDESLFNWDSLNLVGSHLGETPRVISSTIPIRPDSREHIVISDGHRLDKRVDDYIQYTRSHVITLNEDLKVHPQMVAICYTAEGAVRATEYAYAPVDVVQLDRTAVEMVDWLNKDGMTDTPVPTLWVPQAVLDNAFILALAGNQAMRLAPLTRAGLPGDGDNIIRVHSIRELLDQLAYYNIDESEIVNQRYAGRFIVIGKDDTPKLISDMLIMGETPLKFATHAIVIPAQVWSHMKFMCLDTVLHYYHDINTVPFIIVIGTPNDNDVLEFANKAFKADVYGNTFTKIQIVPTALPDNINVITTDES